MRNIDGIVHHIGLLSGEIATGEEVVCSIDKGRRILNTRNHSAGHILDMAVHASGLKWVPKKGYHFPEGPYVEYGGDFADLDVQKVGESIERFCAEFIAQDLPVRIEFMSKEEMGKGLPFVPDNLPANRPVRVVFIGDYGIPCGGTHVSSLKEVGSISVRKIKINGDTLRVSYQIN